MYFLWGLRVFDKYKQKYMSPKHLGNVALVTPVKMLRR